MQRAEDALCRFPAPSTTTGRSPIVPPHALRRQLDRGGADRRWMPAEQRLVPDPASGGERGREDGVHLARRRAGRAGRIECAPDLSEDLGLTEDLRVEPGRHRKQVTHRLRPVGPHQLARERQPSRPREIAEPRLVVVWPRPVELASVAGEEQQARTAGRPALARATRRARRRERELLTNANGRRMVADANDMEREFADHVPRVHGAPERDNTHPSGGPSVEIRTGHTEQGRDYEEPPGYSPGASWRGGRHPRT